MKTALVLATLMVSGIAFADAPKASEAPKAPAAPTASTQAPAAPSTTDNTVVAKGKAKRQHKKDKKTGDGAGLSNKSHSKG